MRDVYRHYICHNCNEEMESDYQLLECDACGSSEIEHLGNYERS